jgi:F-type H+-transporting ATPase subunit b
LAFEDRQRLTAAIRELTEKPETVISYQESPDLINGIAFLASGHRNSWSVSEYLDNLEDSFERALHEEFRQTLPKPP